jgi:hypothetical protein
VPGPGLMLVAAQEEYCGTGEKGSLLTAVNKGLSLESSAR